MKVKHAAGLAAVVAALGAPAIAEQTSELYRSLV